MLSEQAKQAIAAVNHRQMAKTAVEHELGRFVERRVDQYRGDGLRHHRAKQGAGRTLQVKTHHIALGNDAQRPLAIDHDDATLPRRLHRRQRTVQACIRRQTGEIVLHQGIDVIELTEEIEPEMPLKISFGHHAQRFALPISHHQMPNAAQRGAAVGAAKFHLFADGVNRAAHQRRDGLRRIMRLVHRPQNIVLGDNAKHLVGINDYHRRDVRTHHQ